MSVAKLSNKGRSPETEGKLLRNVDVKPVKSNPLPPTEVAWESDSSGFGDRPQVCREQPTYRFRLAAAANSLALEVKVHINVVGDLNERDTFVHPVILTVEPPYFP